MVRVVRLERTVSWSQTRRDTNFAIPGYSLFCHDTTASGKNKVFFCLWSFMWSKPILYRFRQSWKVPQTQALQGFEAFRLTLSRIQPRHSQSRRATNCATPGCSVGIIIPHVEIARKYLLKVFNKLLTVEFCGMSSKFFRPYN